LTYLNKRALDQAKLVDYAAAVLVSDHIDVPCAPDLP